MTEAEAMANILEWSAGIPGWQRDALRRLVSQQVAGPDDVDHFVAICKGESSPVPLDASHLVDPNRDHSEVYLAQVHSVSHVNALAGDQRLKLRREGLTIIYGDNGSGKSGYARILKRACRARLSNRPEDIMPNIYDSVPGRPTAVIEYAISGQVRSCTWVHGQQSDAALSAISVFDSRTANIHVDETNDVAYTPFPLKILATLAQPLCKQVKDKLSAEIAQIKACTPESVKTPACNRDTAVGRIVTRLTANTNVEALESLATFTSAERDRLAQLTADLAADPTNAARQLAARKARVENCIARLDRLFSSITSLSGERLAQLAADSITALNAATAASSALFRDEPLPHIGSEVWQALWSSAKAFSDEQAYPGRSFPVTDTGSVCLLCQQELSYEAATRLNRFEAFIRDDSQRRAVEAQNEYIVAREAFESAAFSLAELKTIIETIRDELHQAALAASIRKAALAALWHHRGICRHHRSPGFISVPLTTSYPREELSQHVSDIQVRAEALTSEAGSPARAALSSEKAELSDRLWLGGVKADVLAEVERLKQIARLEVSQRDTATNRITAKSTEIAQALVTDALRAQFAREVGNLEIAGLAVELVQQTSSLGVPRFKVALTRKPNVAVGQVLSEGEHRCVALAAFMAELATTESRSGIVFDDPVSSLDHMHRQAVAKRLVAEAARRQVVVFTHDLAFLFELNRATDEATPKPPIAISSVSRGTDKAGFCRNEPPFKARRVSDITASLTRHLANERYHFDQGNEDEWRKSVKSIAGNLRDTWEIAVEEAVSHVIRRLSNEVATNGLLKLTAITATDCGTMREGFGRCSELLHSAAASLNRPLPRPEALTFEIDALSAWANDLKQRQARL